MWNQDEIKNSEGKENLDIVNKKQNSEGALFLDPTSVAGTWEAYGLSLSAFFFSLVLVLHKHLTYDRGKYQPVYELMPLSLYFYSLSHISIIC